MMLALFLAYSYEQPVAGIVYIMCMYQPVSTGISTKKVSPFVHIIRRRRLAVIIVRGWNFHFYLLIIQHVFCLSILCSSESVYTLLPLLLWRSYNGERIIMMRTRLYLNFLNNSSLPFHCGWKTRFWWFFFKALAIFLILSPPFFITRHEWLENDTMKRRLNTWKQCLMVVGVYLTWILCLPGETVSFFVIIALTTL